MLPHVFFEVFQWLEQLGGLGGKSKQRLLRGLGFSWRRGNDQWRAGLVDQHVVGFVDQGKPVGPLQQFGRGAGRLAGEHRAEVTAALGDLTIHEPILEEVEAEFLGGAVGDIAGVGLAAFIEIHL